MREQRACAAVSPPPRSLDGTARSGRTGGEDGVGCDLPESSAGHTCATFPVRRAGKGLLLFLTILLSSRVLVTGARAWALDAEAVAEVNGSSISREAFEREWPAFLREHGIPSQEAVTGEELGKLRQALVHELVGRELLYQAAAGKGYAVTEKEVDREIMVICKPLRRRSVFEDLLRRGGFTDSEFREHLRRRLVIERYVKAEIADGDGAGREEEEGLVAQEGPSAAREEIRARHIMIRVPVDAGEEERRVARRRLGEVLADLRRGADFADLARKHSECYSSSRGGDLGFFGRGRMEASFEEVAFSLKEGEISDIIETPYGYHLVTVEERRSRPALSGQAARGGLEEERRRTRLEGALQDHIRQLRKDASVRLPETY